LRIQSSLSRTMPSQAEDMKSCHRSFREKKLLVSLEGIRQFTMEQVAPIHPISEEYNPYWKAWNCAEFDIRNIYAIIA
jgi:hypothetical protein